MQVVVSINMHVVVSFIQKSHYTTIVHKYACDKLCRSYFPEVIKVNKVYQIIHYCHCWPGGFSVMFLVFFSAALFHFILLQWDGVKARVSASSRFTWKEAEQRSDAAGRFHLTVCFNSLSLNSSIVKFPEIYYCRKFPEKFPQIWAKAYNSYNFNLNRWYSWEPAKNKLFFS